MHTKFGLAFVLFWGWLELHGEAGSSPAACAQSLHQSESAYRAGNYRLAEKWLAEGLACQEARLPPAHPGLAASYDRLAELKRLSREFRQAETLLKRAVVIWSEERQRHLSELAEAHNGLALVYYGTRRYREAEAAARQAMTLWIQAQGPRSFGEAFALNALGFLFGALQNSMAAERNFRLALEYQRAGNRRDLLTANLLHNLATIRYELGFPDEAAAYYRESLSLHRELLPAGHPQTARTLAAYVKILKKSGRREEASQVAQRAELSAVAAIPFIP